MSETTANDPSAQATEVAVAPPAADPKSEAESFSSKIPKIPIRSNIPTPAGSVTGIPVKQKPSSNFGSSNSISKIGRPCCTHTTPKAGPPPRDTNSMSRESDDNLSSINSAYTDLYQETVKRFTRSSLSPTSDWERFSSGRGSLKSRTTPTLSDSGHRTSYDYYLEATGRRRSSDHNSTVLTANTEQFIIGQRVWVGGLRSGQIAYIGETHFAPGDWAGIVLDEANGKNDGCVSGKRYFQCEPKRGIFSRLTRLTTYPLSGAMTPTSPLAKNSPERSRTGSPTASVRSSMLRSPGIGKNGLTVGDRVIVSSGFGSRPGILRYLGETQFAPGNWCGVELDEGSGKNDGAVDGIRYFECKPKFGVFVPIAKVSLSPSTKKTRLSRTGSRESLTSIGTMNSIATTNTSRMRMNAQRKSSTPVRPIVTPPKNQFSMQDLLREKQQHVEQLMVERELDREDAQNQALQLQKNINELKARVLQLETQLSDERKKSEELQFSIDEAQFCGDEMNAQSQVYKEKIHDLEKKITQLASASNSLQSAPPAEDSVALTSAQLQITQLLDKLVEQEKLSEARLAETAEEEKRLLDNIGYLKAQNETLQSELVAKDESLEKFSLSQCGIENLRRELALLKEDNEKQAQQSQADFVQKLAAKEEQLQQVTAELKNLRSTSDTLESERANVTDECDILQTEIRMRDEQIKDLNQQLDELTTQLNVQKADSSALDEMLKTQQTSNAESKSQLDQLKIDHEQLKTTQVTLTTEKTQLEQQLQELRAASEQQQQVNGSHKLQLEQQQAEHEQLKTQKAATEFQLEKTLKELDALQKSSQAQLQDSKVDSDSKESKIKEVSQQLEALQQQLQFQSKSNEELLAKQEQLKEAEAKQSTEHAEQLHQAKVKLSETEDVLKATQQQLEQLQQQAAASGEAGAQQLAKLQTEFTQLQAKHSESQNALKGSIASLETSKEQGASLQAALDQQAQELVASKSHTVQLEAQLKISNDTAAQRDLELGDVRRQHEALQTKLETMQQQEVSLQAELQASRGSVSQLQTALRQLKEELVAKQQSYVTLENESSVKLLEMASDKELLQQTNDRLQRELQQVQEHADKLKAEADQRQTQLTEQEQLAIKRDLELGDAGRQREQMEARCQALVQQNDTLQQQLSNLQSSSTDSNAELVKLSQQLVEQQQSNEQLATKHNEERASLERQLQSGQQRIDALCGQVEVLTQELSSSTEQSTQLHGKLKSEQELAAKQALELSDATRKLEAATAKCGQLEQHQEQLQQELGGVRGDQGELTTKLGQLTEQLAAAQKELNTHKDESSTERLQQERMLQELRQQLQASQTLLSETQATEAAAQEMLKAETEKTIEKLEQEVQQLKEQLTKSKEQQEQQSSGNEVAIKELQERLEITNTELQHKEQLAREDAQKISDLKTLVEAIQVANANISATNAELSTVLEVLQAEKSETAHIFELFEMEADMNAERLIEKLQGMKLELQQTHLQLANQENAQQQLQKQLQQMQQAEQTLQGTAVEAAEQLRQLQQANGELQDAVQEKQVALAQAEQQLRSQQTDLETQLTSNKELQQQLQQAQQREEELLAAKTNYEKELQSNQAQQRQTLEQQQKQLQQAKDELQDAVQQKQAALTQAEQQLQSQQTELETQLATNKELQQQLQQAQEREEVLLAAKANYEKELQSNQAELRQTLDQQQKQLEQGNEFNAQLVEYQKVIDEMDEAAKEKTKQLELLQSRLKQAELSQQQAQKSEQLMQQQCQQLTRQLEELELQEAREILTLRANGAPPSEPRTQEQLDTETSLAKINFLNSIIADMQQKNDALKAKVQTLETLPTDFTKPHALDMLGKRKPAPRLFCDICDEFDQHETEDCPLQAGEDRDYSPPPAAEANNNEKKERKLPAPRKYCESCEVFGHDTSECADDETY